MRANRTLLAALCVLVATSFARAEDQMPWQVNVETAQQLAAKTNRLVVIHFWAPWCKPCMRLEKEVFSRVETAKALEANFVFVKVNADEAPSTTRSFGVSSLPTDVIVTPQGRLVSQFQSPPTANQYVAQLNQAAAGHRELARRSAPPTAPAVPVAASPAVVSAPPAAAAMTAPPVAPPPAYAPATSAPPVYAPAPVAPPAAAPSAYVAPPAAPAPAAAPVNSPAQVATNDRYSEYYRQQQVAAPAADAAPPVASTLPVEAAPAAPVAAGVAPEAALAGQFPAAPVGASAQAAPAQAPMTSEVAPAAAAPPTVVAPAMPVASAAAPVQPPVAQSSSVVTQENYTAPVAYQPSTSAPQLPPGCPPAALDGNCPVTLMERRQWAVGNRAWGAVHRGRTYLFVGPDEKEKFLANPDLYSPVLAGLDPVLALDNQQIVPGKREFGFFGPDNRVYLFADEASLKRFEANPRRYAAEVLQAQAAPTGTMVR